MKNSIRFYHIFSAELAKTKRSLVKWILFLFPLFISLIIFVRFYFFESIPHNPWIFIGNNSIFLFYSIFYPLIIATSVATLLNIEYKSSGFKFLFTLPVYLSYIYIAKLLVAFLFILFSTIIAYISYKLGCVSLQLLRPDFNFQDYDQTININLFFLKMFISLICILLIQFILCLKFPNFILTITFALFITISSLVFKFDYSYLIPYKSINMANVDFRLEDYTFFKKEIIAELIYIPILFFVGMCFFIKKR